jgi:hypothetical protein
MHGERVLLDSVIVIDQLNGHRWRLPDAFQAAAARWHRLVPATRNVKDFPPRRFGFVRVPYAV